MNNFIPSTAGTYENNARFTKSRLVIVDFHQPLSSKTLICLSTPASLMVSRIYLMLPLLGNGNNSCHPLKSRENVKHFLKSLTGIYTFPQLIRENLPRSGLTRGSRLAPEAPPSPRLKFLPLRPVLGALLPGQPAAPCAHAHH